MNCRTVSPLFACYTDALGNSQTLLCNPVYDDDGVQIAIYYTDPLFTGSVPVDVSAGTVSFGECPLELDVFSTVVPLAAGNNAILHNLNKVEVEVEVRDDATGGIITAVVVSEVLNQVTIYVPVAVAAARIRVDG